MLSDPPFISYAQNAEDVVLWRAFDDLPIGTYVEVGANDPTSSSITRAFYDRGWSGVEIEPVTEFVNAFRAARPRDTVVQAAITNGSETAATIHVIDGSGLSTLDPAIVERHAESGWTSHVEVVPARRLDDVLDEHLPDDAVIHFLVIDVEGSEDQVVKSLDLTRRRPRVMVIEATAPNSPEPTHESWEPVVLDAGYQFCLFDGLSRFYVADEYAERLRPALSAPGNPLDNYETHEVVTQRAALHELSDELAEVRSLLAEGSARENALTEELIRWRGTVLARWADAATAVSSSAAAPTHEVVHLREELDRHRDTLSWRITAPLREVQRRRLEWWR